MCKPRYLIYRAVNGVWIETDNAESKKMALEILQSYIATPMPDAHEYKVVECSEQEVTWVDVRESKNDQIRDAWFNGRLIAVT